MITTIDSDARHPDQPHRAGGLSHARHQPADRVRAPPRTSRPPRRGSRSCSSSRPPASRSPSRRTTRPARPPRCGCAPQQRANTQYSTNIADANSWLSTADSTLTSSENLVRQAIDLTTQGANSGDAHADGARPRSPRSSTASAPTCSARRTRSTSGDRSSPARPTRANAFDADRRLRRHAPAATVQRRISGDRDRLGERGRRRGLRFGRPPDHPRCSRRSTPISAALRDTDRCERLGDHRRPDRAAGRPHADERRRTRPWARTMLASPPRRPATRTSRLTLETQRSGHRGRGHDQGAARPEDAGARLPDGAPGHRAVHPTDPDELPPMITQHPLPLRPPRLHGAAARPLPRRRLRPRRGAGRRRSLLDAGRGRRRPAALPHRSGVLRAGVPAGRSPPSTSRRSAPMTPRRSTSTSSRRCPRARRS